MTMTAVKSRSDWLTELNWKGRQLCVGDLVSIDGRVWLVVAQADEMHGGKWRRGYKIVDVKTNSVYHTWEYRESRWVKLICRALGRR